MIASRRITGYLLFHVAKMEFTNITNIVWTCPFLSSSSVFSAVCILYVHSFPPSFSCLVSLPLWSILSMAIRLPSLMHMSVPRNVLTPVYGMQAPPPQNNRVFSCYQSNVPLFTYFHSIFQLYWSTCRSDSGLCCCTPGLFPCQFLSSDTLLQPLFFQLYLHQWALITF